jgi:hypothetical protein
MIQFRLPTPPARPLPVIATIRHAYELLWEHCRVELRLMLAPLVPLTYGAFEDYRLGSVTLSAKGLAMVQKLLAGAPVSQETSGLSKREWRELTEQLQLAQAEKAA